MMQTAVVETSSWQEWEGRVVGGRFMLLECLERSDESASYLTKVDGANALLKLLRADRPNADAQVASWELAHSLSHPNLVRIFQIGIWHADEELDMHFAVTEYCEESLADVLRLRPLTSDEVRAMLTPLLAALQYLHEHGIVHGQLNPANILAQGDQLKLTTHTLRRGDDAGGASTPSVYDLPEKASATASFGGDMWSLGMTLCEALTNLFPLPDKDSRPRLAGEIPAPFDAIVKQCLAVDRDCRMSLKSIRDLLDSAVEERSTPALKLNPVSMDVGTTRPAASEPAVDIRIREEPAVKWTNRHTMIGVAAFLLLITVLIGVRVKQKSTDDSGSVVATPSRSGIAVSAASSGTIRRNSSPATQSGFVLHEALPEVTGQARSTIRGTVKVKVKVAVDAQGKVMNATLAAKSPSAYFGRQALQGARRWSFSAPVRDGRPQPAEWIIRFEFRRSGTRATAQPYSPEG